MKRKKSTSFVPLTIMLGGAALSAIVLAQGGKPVSKTAASSAAKADEEPTKVELVRAERKPLEFYTGAVRGDLFSAPQPAPPPTPKVEAPKTPPPAVTPVQPINPLDDYVYSGTVTLNGEKLALLENKKTRDGEYKKVGETFMGGKITEITERSVSLDVAGKTNMLAKSDDYKLTPLDKSATFLTAAPPQPAANPAAAAPQPMGGMMFGQGGRPDWRNMSQEQREQFRNQMMQNMTPEQRERMQQRRMDRQFEGRGNRRGGFGGGDFGG